MFEIIIPFRKMWLVRGNGRVNDMTECPYEKKGRN